MCSIFSILIFFHVGTAPVWSETVHSEAKAELNRRNETASSPIGEGGQVLDQGHSMEPCHLQ